MTYDQIVARIDSLGRRIRQLKHLERMPNQDQKGIARDIHNMRRDKQIFESQLWNQKGSL